jgi:hypothetical protein
MTEVVNLAAHSGLVVQPYRDDQNRARWVFRCWGTDTCDGWLSLDHTSAQTAARALTSHVEEFHQVGSSVPEVKIRITGGLTDMQRREVKQMLDDYARQSAGDTGRQR